MTGYLFALLRAERTCIAFNTLLKYSNDNHQMCITFSCSCSANQSHRPSRILHFSYARLQYVHMKLHTEFHSAQGLGNKTNL